MNDVTVGVDVGGTKVAAGLIAADGTVLESKTIPTPADNVEQTMQAIVEATRAVSHGDAKAVGLAAAGYVNAQRDTLIFSPNLAWRNEPLQARLQEHVDLPVIVENDANAAAWGEYQIGAGRGCDNFVMLTIGTGVGGGIVLNGQLYRGGNGVGAEVGHMQVVPDGRLCGCGQRGCLEQYASGSALAFLTQGAVAADPRAGAEILRCGSERVGRDITAPELQGSDATQAARAGDELARELLATIGRTMGQAAADLTAILDPERFVIGGGVIAAGDLLLEPMRQTYEKRVTGGSKRPRADIVAAQTSNDAGMIGAGLLALKEISA